MNLDDLTVKQVKEIQSLLGTKPKKKKVVDGGVRIVILQRGWVVVGRYHQMGDDCSLENAYVIRNWGTTKGLGEIATNGPTDKTVLDPSPTIRFHELTVVASLDCSEVKWASKLSQV